MGKFKSWRRRSSPASVTLDSMTGIRHRLARRPGAVAARVADGTNQVRTAGGQGAIALATTTRSAVQTVGEQVSSRWADAVDATTKLATAAPPVIASAAEQTRGLATQLGSQAGDRVGAQTEAFIRTVGKQRDDIAPIVVDWAGQARTRLEELGQQAKDELAPTIIALADQTRERLGDLGQQVRADLPPFAAGVVGQAKEQVAQIGGQASAAVGPVAADLASQARDGAARIAEQTRDTVASVQNTAGAVAPAVADAATGTAVAVGGAFDATGRAVRSTVNNLFWLTVLTGIAVFLYAPRDEDRAKLMATLQEWLSFAADLVTELRGGD